MQQPEGGRPQQFSRPPSPLRNGFVPDTSTGIDPHDVESELHSGNGNHEHVHASRDDRSPSPSGSSVSQIAASFAQRVGSLVEGINKPRSGLPTDEELEAEAQRECDRSRREAELILTREAEQRRFVEERALAMMDDTKSLPPPPSRPSGDMSNSSSPASSQKEKDSLSWWTAAKQRLTPTKEKESLTPAQQVIQDAKAREKEQKKNAKAKEKALGEWPTNSQAKFSDPSLHNLNIPSSPQRKPVLSSPVSPTPSRPNLSNMAPNLTPSPMRSVDNLSVSPSREAPPLYTTFNEQGTLDVPGTILIIAKRFEKLEKWTVGHVRALEERMNDVERWLVDKEGDREQKEKSPTSPTTVNSNMNDIRDEISELQGRVGELGREMAKLATAPSNPSSGPSRHSSAIDSSHPINSTVATAYHHTSSTSVAASLPAHSRLSSTTARDSTSPPMATNIAATAGGASTKSSGTKLPYPTGDYTSPNDSFSPPSSPPTSGNSKARGVSFSGLPSSSTSSSIVSAANPIQHSVSPTSSSPNLNLGLNHGSPRTSSTSLSTKGGTSPNNLNAPSPSSSKSQQQQKRQSSVSPTPRKRYTVALGEPIRSQSPPMHDHDVDATPLHNKRGVQPIPIGKGQTLIGTAMFSSSSSAGVGGGSGDGRNGLLGSAFEDMEDPPQDETTGKSAASHLVNPGTSSLQNINNNSSNTNDNSDPFFFPATNKPLLQSQLPQTFPMTMTNTNPRPSRSRPRPQSTYTFGSSSTLMSSLSSFEHHSNHHTLNPPPQASIQPLKPRIRSKSTDQRFGSLDSLNSSTSVSSASSTSSFGGGSNNGSAAVSGKFVDPLLLRKENAEKAREKEQKGSGTGVRGRGKVAVGQLVAFFDEKKGKGE